MQGHNTSRRVAAICAAIALGLIIGPAAPLAATGEGDAHMGASLTMIDRHYGHLARDGRDHAINLLAAFTGAKPPDVHAVDAAWTSKPSTVAQVANGKKPKQDKR